MDDQLKSVENRESSKFYTELLADALRYVDALGGEAAMVSAPLGLNSSAYRENLAKLMGRIDMLAEHEPIFDQTPYLDKASLTSPQDYAAWFKVFYRGLIESGKIKKVYVMPDSEHSLGVTEEISIAAEAGVPIEYLPDATESK